jgi:FMN-binding domain
MPWLGAWPTGEDEADGFTESRNAVVRSKPSRLTAAGNGTGAGYHDSSAIPKLTSEILTAQNGRIDAVSGATYTSAGYTKSLQSALDQARA